VQLATTVLLDPLLIGPNLEDAAQGTSVLLVLLLKRFVPRAHTRISQVKRLAWTVLEATFAWRVVLLLKLISARSVPIVQLNHPHLSHVRSVPTIS
jgi:hypothetical protein